MTGPVPWGVDPCASDPGLDPAEQSPGSGDPTAIGIRHLEMPPGCGRHRPAWAPDRNPGSRPPAGRQLEIGKNADVTTHRRIRPFKTGETDPEQNLDNDPCQAHRVPATWASEQILSRNTIPLRWTCRDGYRGSTEHICRVVTYLTRHSPSGSGRQRNREVDPGSAPLNHGHRGFAIVASR